MSSANAEQNQPNPNSNASLKFSTDLPSSPLLTSYEAGWRNVSLEYHCQPPGETPKLCLDHYAIGIYMGDGFQLEQQIDEVANGRLQKKVYSKGGMTLIPMQHSYWARWEETIGAFMLNLQADLLTRNGAELLGVDHVTFLPRTLVYDPLIPKIALALKADLESNKPGGRLYAETMANALAVHLLRNYSSHGHKSIRYVGGLSPTKLKIVIDYINDYLDQDVSLVELAAIAQLSPYHFCRTFKLQTGASQFVSRHKYSERMRH